MQFADLTERSSPPPGALLGWVVRFGAKLEFDAWIPAERGLTHASQRAAELHGIYLEAVTPPASSDQARTFI